MSNQKLSKEELEKLNTFSKKQEEITVTLGQLDIQKALLEGQRSMILEELSKLQEKQNVTAKELQSKYGDGNIDLDTGEFTLNK